MIYLLPENLLMLMLKQDGFKNKYGNSYADYISNSIELSSILRDLIYSSDSYTDALYIIDYFGIKFTHNYLEIMDKTHINTITENIKLSVSH